MAQRYW